MANIIPFAFRGELFSGTHNFASGGDTFKIALYTSDATLDDVVKHKASILGNHVDSFIKEKANEQQNSSSFKTRVNSESDQASSEKEKGDE